MPATPVQKNRGVPQEPVAFNCLQFLEGGISGHFTITSRHWGSSGGAICACPTTSGPWNIFLHHTAFSSNHLRVPTAAEPPTIPILPCHSPQCSPCANQRGPNSFATRRTAQQNTEKFGHLKAYNPPCTRVQAYQCPLLPPEHLLDHSQRNELHSPGRRLR